MRRRKRPGAKEKLLSYDQWICTDPQQFKGSWADYFNNQYPIHVELGTGRGQFITTLAEKHPQINYIGIEVKEEVLLRAVEKVDEKKLSNIVFLWNDIGHIEDVFDKGEIDRVYINFCDPWPKKRWAKRRLTHKNFLEKYKVLLQEKGEIHFKTDNEKLFAFSLNEFSFCDFKLQHITFNLHEEEMKENVTTEYEDKFTAIGMKIFRCEALKRD
ncbi:tRNA (guanosine(46)-N7)-methyltransferase TrmB [Clostridiaceae bacterium 35-E11]